MRETQDDLEQAVLAQVQSDVDYKQDQLVHAAMVAVGAATDLLPRMVRQYIDRKGLSGNVLRKQQAEAEARLQEVLQEQQRGTMRSPVNGVVLDRLVSNERYLTAGTALLEIGRLEDLEVEADVLSLDVVGAKVGDRVEIYGPAIGRRPAQGVVARIYPAGFTKVSSLGVEQQRVKVIVRFAGDELRRLLADRRLGVGYRVRVKIFTAERSQALLIPRSALFRAGQHLAGVRRPRRPRPAANRRGGTDERRASRDRQGAFRGRIGHSRPREQPCRRRPRRGGSATSPNFSAQEDRHSCLSASSTRFGTDRNVCPPDTLPSLGVVDMPTQAWAWHPLGTARLLIQLHCLAAVAGE